MVQIANGRERATSVRVGLLRYDLVWRPGDGGVRASQEAMLRRHRGEDPVEIVDQGLDVGLGADGGKSHITMGDGSSAGIVHQTLGKVE